MVGSYQSTGLPRTFDRLRMHKGTKDSSIIVHDTQRFPLYLVLYLAIAVAIDGNERSYAIGETLSYLWPSYETAAASICIKKNELVAGHVGLCNSSSKRNGRSGHLFGLL